MSAYTNIMDIWIELVGNDKLPLRGFLRLDLEPAEQRLAESLLVELRPIGPLHLLDPELDQVLEDRVVVRRGWWS